MKPASNKNTGNQSIKNQTSENKKYESKTRNSGSPRKSKDPKNDPFRSTVVEKRFVFDDEDNDIAYEYDYEYENEINEVNRSNKRNNSTQPSKNTQSSHNKNSPKKTSSPRSQLSPRKRKIKQKIMKLEAELKELQSSVISGLTNENSESVNDVAQKIDAKKKKLNELEKLAELEKREIKEENENKELRRRIEILEKNQEEIMSPKPKPNLGFMSPHDAIISIKAQPFDQLKEGSSLIERRKQDPLNVEVSNQQSNKQSQKKKEKQQTQERGISLSSEKKLNESSFCQMNPIEAKNFADKHIEDIVSSDAKKYSSHPVSRSKNLSNHHEPEHQDSNYKSNSSSKKQNELPKSHQRTPKTQKERSHHKYSEQETHPKYNSNHSDKHQSPKKPKRQNVVTRSADTPEDNLDFDRDLSVDVTIVEVKKIPDASLYCVIFTEANKDSASKTKVVNRETDSNILNEDYHFEFNQSIPKSDVLVVIVKKEDLLKGDKIIGSVKIDLSAVIRSMNRKKVNMLDKIFPILTESKVQTEGRLHLILRSDCVDSTNGIKRSGRKQKKEKPAKKKVDDNKATITRKTPSVSDKSNSINEDIVLERDQQIEPINDEDEQPISQPDQERQYSPHSESNASENQPQKPDLTQTQQDKEERILSSNSNSSQKRKQNSNSNQIQKQNSNSSQIKNENSYSSQKQPYKQINNKPQSPKSPKYNWNNGSLINKSNKKKKPIYEILSENEDEQEPVQLDQDTYDENQPALNPSSFPVPTIKYSPSVEAGLEKENDMKDQMTLSLQDILEQTGSPVLTRDINFPFENELNNEEEEEENKNEESLFNLSEVNDSPIEPVSEDEDQINNKLDKKFGKEPPRLSSAEPSEIEYAFNKSEDAVTFNLCDLAKYYEPRFLDTVPQQRRNERKQKQKLNEGKNVAERSIKLFNQIEEEEEENNDQIDAQFEANFNAMKKKQRITKVQNSDEILDSDENEVQLGILPIDDDDDDENDIQIKGRKSPKSEDEKEKVEKENENDKENDKEKEKEEEDADIANFHLSEPSPNSSDNEDDNKSINDIDTEPIDPLSLDCFSSEKDNKSIGKNSKLNTNDKFDRIEKVETSSKISNQKSSIGNSASSISGISLIGETSSFNESSIKSSLSQFGFMESVKKIDEQNKQKDRDDDQFNSDESD